MAAERKRLVEVEGGPGELSLLFEISQILDSSLDLRTVVEPVLEALTRSLGMKFATLTLLNRQTGEIGIESAYGLSPSQKRRGRYKLGEGITGKVIQTGRASIVPKISEEPQFLDRTGARRTRDGEDMSFICVPIKMGREVVGALSADRPVAALSYLQEEGCGRFPGDHRAHHGTSRSRVPDRPQDVQSEHQLRVLTPELPPGSGGRPRAPA